MKRNLIICLLALITPGCWPDEDPNTDTTIDYIRQTGRLWGVAEVILNENDSITLFDAKSSGVGLNLMMRDANNKTVDSITLSPGQSCSLSDGRHAFIIYELKEIEQGLINFMVTQKFDALFLGVGKK